MASTGSMMKHLLLSFGAGALGGLLNALAVWAAGKYGVTASVNVHIAPELTKDLIYTKVVWGGIWGFAFLLPLIIKGWPISRAVANGIVLSLGPSIYTLFFIMPGAGQGMMGQELGVLTPVFVLAFNAVWGIGGMLALKMAAR